MQLSLCSTWLSYSIDIKKCTLISNPFVFQNDETAEDKKAGDDEFDEVSSAFRFLIWG